MWKILFVLEMFFEMTVFKVFKKIRCMLSILLNIKIQSWSSLQIFPVIIRIWTLGGCLCWAPLPWLTNIDPRANISHTHSPVLSSSDFVWDPSSPSSSRCSAEISVHIPRPQNLHLVSIQQTFVMQNRLRNFHKAQGKFSPRFLTYRNILHGKDEMTLWIPTKRSFHQIHFNHPNRLMPLPVIMTFECGNWRIGCLYGHPGQTKRAFLWKSN